METALSILLVILAIELLVIAACFAIITFFIAKTLKSLANFTESLNRIRSFLTVPAIIAAIVSKLFKRGR